MLVVFAFLVLEAEVVVASSPGSRLFPPSSFVLRPSRRWDRRNCLLGWRAGPQSTAEVAVGLVLDFSFLLLFGDGHWSGEHQEPVGLCCAALCLPVPAQGQRPPSS